MTNFEYCKDEILKEGISEFQKKWVAGKVGEARIGEKFTEWLYAEHVEPIMLEQWEYDLIRTHYKEYAFLNFSTLCNLRAAGYFKGVTDTSMTIQEILDRAKIIDYNTCKGCKYENVNEDDGACRSCCRYYEEDLYEEV